MQVLYLEGDARKHSTARGNKAGEAENVRSLVNKSPMETRGALPPWGTPGTT